MRLFAHIGLISAGILLQGLVATAGATEIVAHRGASFAAPENTVASVELAWKLKSDAAEIDIRLSSDGKIIVIHDEEVDRTTGGTGKVKEMTLAELRRLDAGSWKGDRYNGEKLPILSEVISSIPDGKRLFVEIKSDISIIPHLERCFQEMKVPVEKIVIIAFDLETCKQFKKRNPLFEVCWLCKIKRRLHIGPWTPKVASIIENALSAGLDGVDVKAMKPVNASFIRKVKMAGLKLYVYTVDDPKRAKELIRLGVDGLTTNKPELMRALVNSLD